MKEKALKKKSLERKNIEEKEEVCIHTHAQSISEHSLFTPCGDGDVSRRNVSAAAMLISACDGAMGAYNPLADEPEITKETRRQETTSARTGAVAEPRTF